MTPPGLFRKEAEQLTFWLALAAVYLAAGLLLLFLLGCGPIGWIQERSECGLKCPKYSSCKVVQSGVFTATYGCVCDNAQWQYPSKESPCPAPSPSPSPESR